VKKAGFGAAACPIARSVAAIGDVWSLLIMRDAIFGVRRFGEFQKNLGLAKNILAVRLKKLVACGILELKPASDGSAYQEYVPTERGKDLLTVVVALGQWGDRWLVDPSEPCVKLKEAATGLPVAQLQLLSQEGRPLSIRELASPNTVAQAPVKLRAPAAGRGRSPRAGSGRTSAEPVRAGAPG
jgi:DNA-binding HxlR family transcriptional regulator